MVMHICLFTPEYPPFFHGGIATYHLHLARILRNAGHRVTVLTSVAAAGRPEDEGIRVVRLDTVVRKRLVHLAPVFGSEAGHVAHSAAFGLAGRDWLLAHAKTDSIDVVEAPEYGGSAAFLVSEALPPLVVTSHGSIGQVQVHSSAIDRALHHDYRASLEVVAMSAADVVACYGRRNVADWETYLGRPVRYVVPPFLPTASADGFQRPTDAATLGLAVGRLADWKGVLELAEALSVVRSRGRDVSILWVGKDQPSASDGAVSVSMELRTRYPDLWGKSFFWREALTPPEVRAAQAGSDFAVVPSRWDTFNFTAPEALSVGTPLIVSTGAGASDICRHGEDALIVPPEDEVALAAALEQMTDPSVRGRLAEAGRATVARELAPERAVASRLEGYAEAISRHRDRTRLRHAPSLMNPFAWHWARMAELSSAPAVTARLPSRLVVWEAARRLRTWSLRRLLRRTRRLFGRSVEPR